MKCNTKLKKKTFGRNRNLIALLSSATGFGFISFTTVARLPSSVLTFDTSRPRLFSASSNTNNSEIKRNLIKIS